MLITLSWFSSLAGPTPYLLQTAGGELPSLFPSHTSWGCTSWHSYFFPSSPGNRATDTNRRWVMQLLPPPATVYALLTWMYFLMQFCESDFCRQKDVSFPGSAPRIACVWYAVYKKPRSLIGLHARLAANSLLVFHAYTHIRVHHHVVTQRQQTLIHMQSSSTGKNTFNKYCVCTHTFWKSSHIRVVFFWTSINPTRSKHK